MTIAPPFEPRTVATAYLRVPEEDWAALRIGAKTEFRTLRRDSSPLADVELPAPVVAYARHRNYLRELPTMLMVLLERRVEPVFNICEDPEGLAREGFESYDHFRTYWRKRYGQFVPMEKCVVWRVRPWRPDDVQELGALLLCHLYKGYGVMSEQTSTEESETEPLTPHEAKCIRVALAFGDPAAVDLADGDLERAKRKLVAIERGANRS